ncbi:MAG: FkbM family methyltransferase [Ruminococcus sp.]|nr:FkbM family methyltransferase [Ruminococcus sp.]
MPVFIYGMGNGADKILAASKHFGITIAGFFASDEFVRGHFFRGHKVHTLAEIEAAAGDFAAVAAFGSNRPEILERFRALSKKHKFYSPDVPVCGDSLFDRAFYEKHREEIAEAEKLFCDEKSRRLYKNIIDYKISGDISFLENDSDSAGDIIKEAASEKAERGELVYADLGAYDGDTVRLFAEHFPYKKIYAFEPNEKNFRKLCDKTKHLSNIEYINKAAWDKTEEIAFSDTDNRNNNAFSGGGKLIPAARADDFFTDADIVKLDVEGAERQALSGLSENIKNGATVICAVYHRSEDIFEIPLMFKKMRPESTFKLRKVPYVPAWDVFLIAL